MREAAAAAAAVGVAVLKGSEMDGDDVVSQGWNYSTLAFARVQMRHERLRGIQEVSGAKTERGRESIIILKKKRRMT